MGKASWVDATKIWSWCVKYGNRNTNWAKKIESGDIDRMVVDSIINSINAGHSETVAKKIKAYLPGFELISNTTKTKPAEVKVKEPEKPKEKKESKIKKVIKEFDMQDIIEPLREKLGQLSSVVDPKHIERLTELIQSNIEKVKNERSVPEYPIESNDYIKPKIFNEVTNLIKNKIQVLLTGAAGCGKSRLFQESAKSLKYDFFTFSMAGGMRYSQVFGREQIMDDHSEFVEGQLLKAIQKPGVVFIDEIFGADSDVILGLNCLAEPNTRKIETPKGTIQVHPDCRIVAAANTTGRQFNKQYTGAKRADDSLLDRFVTFNMEYESKVEEKLLKNIKLDIETKDYFLEQLEMLRRKIRENNIAFDASTRRLIQASKIFQSGLTKERAFELAFLSPLSKAEQATVQGA